MFDPWLPIKFAMIVAISFFAGYWLAYWANKIWRSKKKNRPVVCICRHFDRVAFVLRDNYDEASRKHWGLRTQGQVAYRGKSEYISVQDAFVFLSTEKREIGAILNNCFVEEATFLVPLLGLRDDERVELRRAWIHFGLPENRLPSA